MRTDDLSDKYDFDIPFIGINYVDCSINDILDPIWGIVLEKMKKYYRLAMDSTVNDIQAGISPELFVDTFVFNFNKLLQKKLILRNDNMTKELKLGFWINETYKMMSDDNPEKYTDDPHTQDYIQEILDYAYYSDHKERYCCMLDVYIFCEKVPWIILLPENIK